jgi:tetratricopeptide (TPR) repeat protein
VGDLVRARWVARYDRDQEDNPYWQAFIQEVHDIFADKTAEPEHYSEKERYYFQLEEAFGLAVKEKDPRLKEWLHDLYDFCTYRGYAHFYLRLAEAVEELFHGDRWAMRAVYGHRALILQNWGKLAEAMASHQQQEEISEELGDRAGLARTWWNQGELQGKQGDPHAQALLWQKAIDTWKSMGMPTEKYEKDLKELRDKLGK